MDNLHRLDLREQYKAPDLTTVAPEILAYIERLEQGILEVAQTRDEYADALFDTRGQLDKIKAAAITPYREDE